jgi:hypothetical protein
MVAEGSRSWCGCIVRDFGAESSFQTMGLGSVRFERQYNIGTTSQVGLGV